jgi:protein gp37
MKYWDTAINPTRGCTAVSEACLNCWAKGMHQRFNHSPFDTVTVRPDQLARFHALPRSRRRVVFVGNMTDLFHDQVPDDHIIDVLRLSAQNPQHTFLFLTKRAERMKSVLSKFKNMLSRWTDQAYEDYTGHMWMGVTAENDQRWLERVPTLLEAPAAHRWVSAEPLLGPVNPVLCWVHRDGAVRARIDLVVAGFESGPHARLADAAWAYDLKKACADANVRFHWKQWGDGDVFGDREMRCLDDITAEGDVLDGEDYSKIAPGELWRTIPC